MWTPRHLTVHASPHMYRTSPPAKRLAGPGMAGCVASWVRRGWTAAPLLLACCFVPNVLASAAPVRSADRPSAAALSFPITPAGRQASWFLNAVLHHPIPASQVAAHFDQAFLATLPAPAAGTLNASFVDVKSLLLDSVTSSTTRAIAFIVTVNGTSKVLVNLAVDTHGLISALHLGPVTPPAPTTTSAPPTVPGVRQIGVGVGSPPLKGTLTLPKGRGPFPAVVLVSGSGPNDQNEDIGPNHPFLDIAVALASRGIATLRYDKRTYDYPQSINPRTFTATQEYVPDALAAISLLEHEPAVNPHLIFVLGHSQGGTYAPLIAKDAPGVAGVILLAAGAETLGEALLRQERYLATLPGTIGTQAKAELPYVAQIASQIGSVAQLEKDSPTTVLFGGVGPAYYLSALRYNEVATARSLPQPLLLLQGDRDYQVTVANDLDVWLRGLKGRTGLTVVQFPYADHLFLDGTGRATPLEYNKPGRVDPKVTATIAAWVEQVARRSPSKAGLQQAITSNPGTGNGRAPGTA